MENPVITLFLALGILIAAARGAGALARRINQPRVLGELIVGVLLGPTLIDILHSSFFGLEEAHLEEVVIEFAELGVLFLMFKVGLEVHLRELMQVGVVAAIAGVLGAVLPVAMTVPLALAFDYEWQPALFAGVALAATSVSISAQVLLELNVLHTKEGNALLATALVDDVVAIMLVSVTIAVTTTESGTVDAGELVIILAEMIAFIVVAGMIAWFILPRLAHIIEQHPEDAENYGIAAYALIAAMLFGWAAEYFGGVATITGAFIAGVGLSRTHPAIKQEIEVAVNSICYAFLVPIFFVSVGLQIDLSTFPMDALPFAVLLLAFAVISKIIGCGVGARLGGFNNLEAIRVGTCMISRGEVGLIIAALGLSTGTFSAEDPLFAALFLVILVTTVLTPPFVRRVFDVAGAAAPESEDRGHAQAGSAHHPVH